MSTKDLCRKYSASGSKQALNRAIRAEIPGGPEALDGLEQLHQLVRETGSPEAGAALNAILDVVRAMEREVRRRYDMPDLAE